MMGFTLGVGLWSATFLVFVIYLFLLRENLLLVILNMSVCINLLAEKECLSFVVVAFG